MSLPTVCSTAWNGQWLAVPRAGNVGRASESFSPERQAMTVETLSRSEVMSRWARAADAGDMNEWLTCFTPDVDFHDVPSGHYLGHEELNELGHAWFDAMSDISFTVKRRIEQGDVMAVHWVLAGGLEREIPGVIENFVKGTAFEISGVSMLEFSSDGLIRRQTDHWDMASFLRQVTSGKP
jgi:steroid delta-isomerase-like uncharacterized protein